ncbi:MAG: hypothetical protein LBR90_01070 [Elusimicrobiota bacterium]|jgi:Skp family chaperone for outer membrane proteins|nr:hypothetical protein [Elusimicrobiota bacterium]
MKKGLFILLLGLTCALSAQEAPQVFEAFTQTPEATAPPRGDPKAQSSEKMALEKNDTAVVVPVANTETGPQAQQSAQPLFKIAGTAEELKAQPVPQGTLAIYINVEEAFNKNPWTIQARRSLRLELETTQLEYAQIQEQLKELKTKAENLQKEIDIFKPFYQKTPAPAQNANTYPSLPADSFAPVLDSLLFAPAAEHIASPENTPQKLQGLQNNLDDTRKTILEKEAFLLNYKEMSKEEALSRQDRIVQEILKEIYSGIREYAAVRNIGLVVDKKDLIYGKPLDVTDEFVKWMKNYHKKYLKEHGDIL